MGRKPIPPGDRCIATSITLKPDIMSRLIAAANRRGMSLSALIADLALKGLPGYEAPERPVMKLRPGESGVRAIMAWWAEQYPGKPFKLEGSGYTQQDLDGLNDAMAAHAKAMDEYNAKLAIAAANAMHVNPEREA